jgi:hypothetical protein
MSRGIAGRMPAIVTVCWWNGGAITGLPCLRKMQRLGFHPEATDKKSLVELFRWVNRDCCSRRKVGGLH